MAINATNSGTKRELIPAANYIARCYQMIEIGTVDEVIKGQHKLMKKVRIGWELPTELRVFDEAKGKQPLIISQEYTLSLNEKSNLRKMLASWRGKDFTKEEAEKFDITVLVGIPCMLNIIHKPKESDPSVIYETIGSISAMPKGVKPLPAALTPIVLSYDSWNEEKFNSLPDFVKTKIQSSAEYKAMKTPQEKEIDHAEQGPDDINAESDEENDLPF